MQVVYFTEREVKFVLA